MMHDREIVSIIELAFYIPTVFAAVATCVRHGFHRRNGWVFTLILCIVRIVGAICQICSEHDESDGLITATIIIDSIGLSPLLLATLGMLSRFVDSINANSRPIFTAIHFRLLQVLVIVGLVLSIVGSTNSTIKPDGDIEVQVTSKVGIALYIVAYVSIVLVYLVSIPRTSVVPGRERRVPVAIFFALPFVLVRLIYSECSVFLHSHLFNLVAGSVIVHVTMAVAEEFVVITIYVVLGFLVDKLNVTSKEVIAETEWPTSKSQNETGIGRNLFGMLGARILHKSNDEEQLSSARH